MILPATSLACLVLLILTLFCWGSWANTQKFVFKWRFELYYYDFIFGLVATIAILSLVLGNMNPQELSFSDNLQLSSYRKMAYAVGTGVILNLGLILLSAAISLSGLGVAFPVALGVAMVISSVWNFIASPQSFNAPLLFSGAVLGMAAVLVDVFAYRSHLDALAAAAKQGPMLDPRTKLPVRTPIAARGILISVFSGLLLGCFLPLADWSRGGDNGVGPYPLALLMAIGMFGSTLLYVPFFINFPVQGDPIQVRDYFKGAKFQHVWGVLGGMLWGSGLIALFVAGAAPPAVQPSPVVSSLLLQGAGVFGALWGIFAWREFADAKQGAKMLLLVMAVLYLASAALIGLSPAYLAK